MVNKSKIQILTPINIIGFILVAMAGWVDTVGVKLFISERSSFMSGRGAALGYWAFRKDLKAFMAVLFIIIAFIIGAFISTIITKKIGLAGGLCFTGLLIIAATFFTNYNSTTIATIIIPMAMGSQNAATSLTLIGRTTHLTGIATDIGINIAKGNLNTIVFGIVRWVGFPLGSIIGLNLVHMVNDHLIHISTTLICPAIIIILTAITQKLFINIPLLDNINKLDKSETN